MIPIKTPKKKLIITDAAILRMAIGMTIGVIVVLIILNWK